MSSAFITGSILAENAYLLTGVVLSEVNRIVNRKEAKRFIKIIEEINQRFAKGVRENQFTEDEIIALRQQEIDDRESEKWKERQG